MVPISSAGRSSCLDPRLTQPGPSLGATKWPYYIGAAASILLGVYSFLLPKYTTEIEGVRPFRSVTCSDSKQFA